MKKRLVILVTPIGVTSAQVRACVEATTIFADRGHRVICLLEESFRGRASPYGFEECLYRRQLDFEHSDDIDLDDDDENDQNHHTMNDQEMEKEKTQNSNDEQNRFSCEIFRRYAVAAKSTAAAAADKRWGRLLKAYHLVGAECVDEKFAALRRFYSSKPYRDMIVQFNAAIERAIDIYRPDLLWYSSGAADRTVAPVVHRSGVRWIRQLDASPIFWRFHPELPPGGSGLATDGDRKRWAELNATRRALIRSSSLNDLFESLGYARYPADLATVDSQSLTVYAYPEELNYLAIRRTHNTIAPAVTPTTTTRTTAKPTTTPTTTPTKTTIDHWFNLEAYRRRDKYESYDRPSLEQLLPREFLAEQPESRWSGKWILLHIDRAIAHVERTLIRRLTIVLGKSNHKYIVLGYSDHHHHQEDSAKKLPQNMFSLDEIEDLHSGPHLQRESYSRRLSAAARADIIANMDLVITLGGDHALLVEIFSTGIPIVALPLTVDQVDDAQRLHETRLGVRVDPYCYADEQLINAINRLIYNDDLHRRLRFAAKRIASSCRHEELAIVVERLCEM